MNSIKSIVNYIKNMMCFMFKKNIKINFNIKVTGSKLNGNNSISSNTIFTNSLLGYGSYIGANCIFNRAVVGKYCSIGNNVTVITGQHPVKKIVSTHPAFFSLLKQANFTYVSEQKFNEIKYFDIEKKNTILIENDVWIGNDVSIMSGIKIGNGAIIGTKSLITKDVEPYSIVGGVPARKIGQRFKDAEITILLETKWWEKEEEWIKNNIHLFFDIETFTYNLNNK